MKLEGFTEKAQASFDGVSMVTQSPLSALSAPAEVAAADVKMWTTGKLSPSLHRQIARVASSRDVVRMAVMPDVHEGLHVPNGSVVATRNLVYPAMVGSDIGCGVSALRFKAHADNLSKELLEGVLQQLQRVVPTLKVPGHLAPAALPETCAIGGLSDDKLNREARREGRLQLGTLGRGNHFIELERDQEGSVWALVHTGSRAMGQVITEFHLAHAEADARSGLAFLDTSDAKGQAYMRDMEWAVRYATESRLLILNRVADLLERRAKIDLDADSYIDSPHNMARVETHFGERLIVHRKSANSARQGEVGIIPGSMSVGSRISVGLGKAESLDSSSHGAGRAMSRSEAFQDLKARDVHRTMDGIVFNDHLADKLRDEAPRVYKDLNEVMRAQRDLVRTSMTLSPILNDKRV